MAVNGSDTHFLLVGPGLSKGYVGCQRECQQSEVEALLFE